MKRISVIENESGGKWKHGFLEKASSSKNFPCHFWIKESRHGPNFPQYNWCESSWAPLSLKYFRVLKRYAPPNLSPSLLSVNLSQFLWQKRNKRSIYPPSPFIQCTWISFSSPQPLPNKTKHWIKNGGSQLTFADLIATECWENLALTEQNYCRFKWTQCQKKIRILDGSPTPIIKIIKHLVR